MEVLMKPVVRSDAYDTPPAAGPSPSLSSPTSNKPGTRSVLLNRDYVLLFWGQLISSAGTQMQAVAVAVYLLTHSAVALGVIALCKAIPRIMLSLVGGVFADAFDRRKLLLIIELILAATSSALALCTIYHVINIYIIGAVMRVAATYSACEFAACQALIPMLVPREQMPMAMSLSMVMMQMTIPDELRGRMSAANAMFVTGGPMLGNSSRAWWPASSPRAFRDQRRHRLPAGHAGHRRLRARPATRQGQVSEMSCALRGRERRLPDLRCARRIRGCRVGAGVGRGAQYKQ
jgi:Transmembrane secretion effector